MNIEQLNVRIKQLEDERAQLVAAHDNLVAQFQQLIFNNRNRFQQLSGAIDELKELIKPKGDNNNDEPILTGSYAAASRNPDWISGHLSGDRGYSGANIRD